MSYVEINGDALRELFESPSGEIARDLQRRALQVDRAAKQLCPVDTGRLRSSITNQLGADAEGLVAVVGTNVEYAPYVELGTRNAPAQAFLLPALEAGQ